MNEAETRAEHIDPALSAAGWGKGDSKVLREHRITEGRILGARPEQRDKRDIADYVLVYRNQKLAVIEAKAWREALTEGLGQAKRYAGRLALRFAYATNGQGIYAVDMYTGKEGTVSGYPSPEELWNMVFAKREEWLANFDQVPYPDKSGNWHLRFYQELAVNRVLEKISAKTDRILLTLATGTGKTSIAFQIVWKLFQARWNLRRDGQRRPRVLFLADRNTLANQAFNDFTSFAAFSDDALVRIKPDEIRKKKKVPTNGSVFFTIFQTFMTNPPDADGEQSAGSVEYNFGKYPQDFFDLIIVDECHRGGANDESQWRAILEYFSPAVQLGLTATPKRKDNADTYRYFGEPVYTYSLKEGINDGFLTPFRVKEINTTLDEYRYAPEDTVLAGEIDERKIYDHADFNRKIEIEAREKKRVEIFMADINQNEKTLVFCANQAHAALVRDLINQTKTSADPNYCARVTANDGEDGEQFLRDFQDNEKTIPTILTTSQKLSTGVDARNIRNIVLLRPVNTMIEFKQIIGRGTRLYDGKAYFTIYDFTGACKQHLIDPEWDGEPLEPAPPADADGQRQRKLREGGDPEPRDKKIVVQLADGKERQIQHMISTSFWDASGTPISAEQFLKNLYGELPAFFKDEKALRELWSQPKTREQLLEGLAAKGYNLERLEDLQRVINAQKSDLFDVLAYIAFAWTPVSREERAKSAQAQIAAHYPDRQRAFLDFVLSQYVKVGVDELSRDKLTQLLNLRYHGAINDAVADLGENIGEVFADFQRYLYSEEPLPLAA